MRVHDCFALDHVNQHVCTLGALGLGAWDSNSDQACHDMVGRAPGSSAWRRESPSVAILAQTRIG